MNPHFKNSYVDVNSVLEDVLPVLYEANVLLIQPTKTEGGNNYLHTEFIDIEDGSKIEMAMILPPNLDAQKTGSALKYYRRYMIVSFFGLQTVDDDGKVGSNPIKDKKKPTEEMMLEIESLMNGDQGYRTQWLNFIGVDNFNKASFGQIEKAIKQIKA